MTNETVGVQRRRRRSDRAGALYEPLDWVLVRAPVLPVEAYLTLSTNAPAGSGPTLAPTDPLLRTALAVASPDLFDQLERRTPGAPDAHRLVGKLLRYAIRMSTRPTPFGLFAGVGLARLGNTTDLRIGDRAPRTRMRPDMAWLLAFVAQLERRPEVRRELRVLANPSIWIQAGRAFVERDAVGGNGDSAAIGVRATGAVRRALELSRSPIAWHALAAELLATPAATDEKVDRLLTQLWQQTFLMTELRPPLTHPSPARYVEQRLAGIASANTEHAVLAEMLDEMVRWDGLDIAGRPEALRRLNRRAAAAVPDHDGACVQVDSALALEGDHLSVGIAHAAARAAELLLRLSPAAAAWPSDAYRNEFIERYGVDREVPLLELLDADRGLGPPTGSSPPLSARDTRRLAIRHATLRHIALTALRERRLAVELDEPTLAKLEQSIPDATTAPVSLDLSVLVLADSAADIDAGEFRMLVGPNLGAQAAGRNLGRFADMLGEPAASALAAVAAAEIERSPGDLHAELVYLPSRGRSANVVIRTPVYEHEVVVATTPRADQQHAIPMSELLVGVHDGRFYVRWPAAPGDLHVHAGHMLTARMAPASCRFLEDVARGDRMPLTAFQWGAAGDLPFLPRLEVDRIVLSPAQWEIDVAARDASLPPDDGQFPAMLARWRSGWMVPRRVYLAVGDNRLLLDLDVRAHVEQLQEELRRMRDDAVLLLQEPLPGPEHAWMEGTRGSYLPELVVSLVQHTADRVSAPPSTRTPAVVAPPSVADRMRPPGSDWLYAKLYGSRDGQDELLAGQVRSLGEFAVGSGLAERWFFVRYADPEPHLRVRFAGEPDRLMTDLLPRVCEWARELFADGSCIRLSFDTYEREVERYGGLDFIALAEAIFAVDSRTVVDLLHLERSANLTLDRTELAVLSVDSLLDGLGMNPSRRLTLYRDAVATRRASGDEYRRRQQALRRILSDHHRGIHHPGGPALARVLHARRAAFVPLATAAQELAASGRLTKPLDQIWQSVVHLHCNRLLGTGPPAEQQVLGLLLRTREGLERAPVARP